MNIFNVTLLILSAPAAACLIAFSLTLFKKLKIDTTVQVQCSSGDSEVMSFNYNFSQDESDESKASKLKEAFDLIQDRRDENHLKFLEIKAEAIKENEAKVASGEDLKLASITQGKKAKEVN